MAPIPYDVVIEKAEYWTEAAFGLHSPGDQLMGAFVLGILLIATSALSLGWTLLLLWIPIVLFFVGVVRIAWGGLS